MKKIFLAVVFAAASTITFGQDSTLQNSSPNSSQDTSMHRKKAHTNMKGQGKKSSNKRMNSSGDMDMNRNAQDRRNGTATDSTSR